MRILTNRNFSYAHPFEKIKCKSVEWIDKNEHGFMWGGEDYSDVRLADGEIEVHSVGFAFPVDLEFVKEKFIECGRVFDEARI